MCRRLFNQLAEAERGRAGGRWIGTEAGHVTGQVPALTLVQLIAERGHLGAVDAQAEGIEQVIQAQAVEPRLVLEIARWRLQA